MLETTLTKQQIKERRKLLKDVYANILEEPRRMHMAAYIFSKADQKEMGIDRPACGTVGCFAGWTVATAKGWSYKQLYKHRRTIESTSNELLGLELDGGEPLYHVGNWPEKWQQAVLRTKPGTKAYAKAVVGRMKEFFKDADKRQLTNDTN